MTTLEELGTVLRGKREHAGLTVEELAAAVRVHVETINQWERGEGLHKVARFFNALEACGVTVKIVSDRGPIRLQDLRNVILSRRHKSC